MNDTTVQYKPGDLIKAVKLTVMHKTRNFGICRFIHPGDVFTFLNVVEIDGIIYYCVLKKDKQMLIPAEYPDIDKKYKLKRYKLIG